MDDLLQEFIAETRETLEALAGEIVAWESAPGDRARLDAIFRFVHTVKGSCGFLDLPRLARMSHAAEDALSAVRDGQRAPDTALVNAVLAVVDRIGELVEAIDAGAALDDSSDDLLIAALAEDAKPAASAAPSAVPRAATRSVRLSVDLLDRMMGGMSDMVLARNELARRLRDASVDPAIEAALERLSLTVAEMRDTVTRTRMQKIDALFSALPRMVRDTAAELGKAVQLHIEGSDVELDREMIEMMRDPLVHIIRNAVDHGLESPAGRRAAGKRETGHLRVCARQSGNQIVVEISDDGQGIDTQRLIAKAASRGTHAEHQLMAMSEQARLDLVFEAGLSSRDSVTTTSGRGVGMDVVRANIEQIGGRIALTNLPGRGLTITIQVPLTLSIMPTIIVRVGDQRFALARQAIEEIIRVRSDAVRIDRLGDAQVVTVRGRRLPLVALGALLGITGGADTLAIVGTREGDYALAIDEVLDTEELVVKPAAPAVMATGVYTGQCLPDSGLPMLLLDGTGMAMAAGLRFGPLSSTQDDEDEAVSEPGTPALLFEDLDGQRRVIALAAVDRVEPVAVGAIRSSAGRLRLVTSGGVVPLHAVVPIGDRSHVRVLRLTDGLIELAYAVDEAIDIVELPAHVAPAHPTLDGGGVIGVVMIDGEPVELVDPHALFAHEIAPMGHRPLCLLHGDDTRWMEAFLKPVLESSGYRCTTKASAGDPIAVTLSMQGDADTPHGMTGTPVIRLRRDPHGDDRRFPTIYRYDRQGLMNELARQVGQSGGGR